MLYSIIFVVGIDIVDVLESLGFCNVEEMESLLSELGGMEYDEKMWGVEKRKVRQFVLDKFQNKKVLDGKGLVDVELDGDVDDDGGEEDEVV